MIEHYLDRAAVRSAAPEAFEADTGEARLQACVLVDAPEQGENAQRPGIGPEVVDLAPAVAIDRHGRGTAVVLARVAVGGDGTGRFRLEDIGPDLGAGENDPAAEADLGQIERLAAPDPDAGQVPEQAGEFGGDGLIAPVADPGAP